MRQGDEFLGGERCAAIGDGGLIEGGGEGVGRWFLACGGWGRGGGGFVGGDEGGEERVEGVIVAV